MKASLRQAAGAGDSVDGAGEGGFEQRRRRRRGADRLAPRALRSCQFGLRAEVAEVALVDREGLREGDRERFDVGVAFAGLQVEPQARVLGPSGGLLAAELGDRHPRIKAECGTVVGVEVGGEVSDRALVADPLRGDREGTAVGRVDHEVRLVDIDLDRAHPDRDPADDLRHRFGVGDHVSVERVDVQGDADDDGAVVIGAGEGRGDRDQAERSALEGAGEVDPADRVEGV